MYANEIDHIVIDVWDKYGNHRHIDETNLTNAIRKLEMVTW